MVRISKEGSKLRYVIDWKNEIVDFYVEDDYGREHHCGLSFDEAKEMFREIMGKLFSKKFEDAIWDTVEPYIEDRGVNRKHSRKELRATLEKLLMGEIGK